MEDRRIFFTCLTFTYFALYRSCHVKTLEHLPNAGDLKQKKTSCRTNLSSPIYHNRLRKPRPLIPERTKSSLFTIDYLHRETSIHYKSHQFRLIGNMI